MQAISCPVCWGQLETANAGCTRCQTPHHEECFAFTGGCAVFGCGGKAHGAISFSSPALEMTESGADATHEQLAAQLAAEGEQARRAGLPRGSIQRMADAFRCLARNWRLAATVALITALFDATGAFLLNVTPTSGQQREHATGTGTAAVADIESKLAEIDRKLEAINLADGRSQPGKPRVARKLAPDAPKAPKTPQAVSPELGVRFFVGMFLLLIGRNLLPFFYSILVMVYLFSAARGKDLPVGDFIGLAMSRVGRCIGASIVTWFVVVLPSVLACVAAAMTRNGWVMFFVISTALVWMLYMFNEYWLVIPIAAMGAEEEPGNILARSRELVAVDRFRIWRGTMLCAMVMGFSVGFSVLCVNIVSFMLPSYEVRMIWETAGIMVTTMITLVMPIYQALLYFECRRALDASFLKFAPTGMTGTEK